MEFHDNIVIFKVDKKDVLTSDDDYRATIVLDYTSRRFLFDMLQGEFDDREDATDAIGFKNSGCD